MGICRTSQPTMLWFPGILVPLCLAACQSQPVVHPTEQSKPVASSPDKASGGLNWVGLAYPTGDKSSSAVWLEKGVPSGVAVNQPFVYRLRVTNLTDATLTDVIVSDQLPKHFKLSTVTPDYRSGDDGRAEWVFASLGAGQSKVIEVKGAATEPVSLQGCCSVAYNTLLCTTIPVVQPKLILAKSAPAKVLMCDAVTVRFVITNPGSGAAHNVVMRGQLPEGLVTSDMKTTYVARVGTLSAGQERIVNATFKALYSGKYELKSVVTADGGLQSEASATTFVTEPVLKLVQECPEKAFIGRTVCSRITISNTGTGAARDLTLASTVPAGSTFVSTSGQGQHDLGQVAWQLGTLAPGASRSVELCYQSSTAGTLRITTTAKAHCAKTVDSSCQTAVTGIPAILLEVVDVNDPIQVGDSTTYAITVTNQGSSPATNIKVTCTLEDAMQYVSSSGATPGSIDGNTITFSQLASLAPKARASWKVNVKAVSTGDVRFMAAMISDQLKRPVQETEATNYYE